jgi:uncharacterized membrane protein/thiol-disulfide isomerase/thioredoxin
MLHNRLVFKPVVLLISLYICLSLVVAARAQTEEPPVVHAVLFFSPGCSHCQIVVNRTLPPLVEQYGEQLVVLAIDVTQPQGLALYQAAIANLGFRGVPLLFIGDEVLLGSSQIPTELPGLIEQYLAQGGVGWPDLPGLAEALGLTPTPVATETASLGLIPVQPSTAEPVTQTESLPIVSSGAAPTALPTPLPTPAPLLPFGNIDMLENFNQDRLGGTLAIIVLAGLTLSVVLALGSFWRITEARESGWQIWLIPLLALLGLAVAGYLAFVETSQATAYCGPVGDCNTVQQSEYAVLFGVPVGILGVAGYLGILLAWVLSRIRRLAVLAAWAIFLMALGGTLFSIYLTFLEPFVIGAVCLWCLTSAVLMGTLLISATWYLSSRQM